ncbi:MAG: NFACT RNA binding domain-containing protein [Myxococcales bacterium]|nr:NFACT RNA binding domain-containing protein [Myxococcales bacterium]
MLSLRELERATAALGSWRGARLDRIVQRDHELDLVLAGGEAREPGERLSVLLSCRPGFARLSARRRHGPAPPTPPALAQYLKAHVEGGRLREVGLRGGDRQAVLVFETREGRFTLLLSLLGPRSNIYLLDARDHLLLEHRPLSETRRDLARGEPWSSPPSNPPPAGEDRFESVGDDELLFAIESHYQEAEAGSADDSLRRRLRQAIKKRGDGLRRKQRRLQQDLADAAKGAEAGRLGELLKGALSEVQPRATSVQATDPATGESVEIALDPKLSPAQNLEAYFKRAKKAVKREQRAQQDESVMTERLAAVEALAAELDGLEAGELAAFGERGDVVRLLERHAPRVQPSAPEPKKRVWKVGKRELTTRLIPKCYEAAGGLEIWVGKNDEGNDILTTRLARGHDLFFHLEGSPGSHVVLRTGKGEPPHEALLDAAELSVHFSKQKNSTRAGVHVAQIKDVSKPRGAKPGLVYVHRGRTLQLRREPERLKRVLDSRKDD